MEVEGGQPNTSSNTQIPVYFRVGTYANRIKPPPAYFYDHSFRNRGDVHAFAAKVSHDVQVAAQLTKTRAAHVAARRMSAAREESSTLFSIQPAPTTAIATGGRLSQTQGRRSHSKSSLNGASSEPKTFPSDPRTIPQTRSTEFPKPAQRSAMQNAEAAIQDDMEYVFSQGRHKRRSSGGARAPTAAEEAEQRQALQQLLRRLALTAKSSQAERSPTNSMPPQVQSAPKRPAEEGALQSTGLPLQPSAPHPQADFAVSAESAALEQRRKYFQRRAAEEEANPDHRQEGHCSKSDYTSYLYKCRTNKSERWRGSRDPPRRQGDSGNCEKEDVRAGKADAGPKPAVMDDMDAFRDRQHELEFLRYVARMAQTDTTAVAAVVRPPPPQTRQPTQKLKSSPSSITKSSGSIKSEGKRSKLRLAADNDE